MNVQLRRTIGTLLGILLMLASVGGIAYAQEDDLDRPKQNPESPDAITLPNSGSTDTAGTAWSITNIGEGRAGYFLLDNAESANPALQADTSSTADNAVGVYGAVRGSTPGSGASGVKGVNLGSNANGYGVMGRHNGGGIGVYGLAVGAGGRGVYGSNSAVSGTGKGVQGLAAASSGFGGYFLNTALQGEAIGVYGSSNSNSGVGVRGESSRYIGVEGTGGYAGVYGNSASFGVYGYSENAGVFGEGQAFGVFGTSNLNTGVAGHFENRSSTFATGLRSMTGNASPDFIYNNIFKQAAGEFTGYNGLIGASDIGGTGVTGWTSGNGTAGNFTVKDTGANRPYGVYASANARAGYPTGVYAGANDWGTGRPTGVETYAWSTNGDLVYGIFSRAGSGNSAATRVWAGYFSGNVFVNGACCSAAQLSTRIDDPLDPANKYLDQVGVVSGERLGIFNGNVTLDGKGQAVVRLPDWVGSTYGDFRYQLTTIGGAALVYVAKEVQDGQFIIEGGKEGLKVSWEVSGVRKDAYAAANPIQPRSDKPADEKGTYLYPREAGVSAERGLNYAPPPTNSEK